LAVVTGVVVACGVVLVVFAVAGLVMGRVQLHPQLHGLAILALVAVCARARLTARVCSTVAQPAPEVAEIARWVLTGSATMRVRRTQVTDDGVTCAKFAECTSVAPQGLRRRCSSWSGAVQREADVLAARPPTPRRNLPAYCGLRSRRR